MEGFNELEYHISEDIKIYLVDIETLDAKLLSILDTFFVEICEGDSGTPIELVKLNFKEYLDNKTPDLEKGSIAELFIHLFLNYLGYKQECLFENLEENSIKKGFDGYYSLGEQEWIMESKSGSINSKTSSHENKVTISYNDLKSKVGKKQPNNPWKNAYYHARVRRTKDSIVENIKSFSDDYIKGIYYKIGDFNIIPTSTIFLDGIWEKQDKEILKNKILSKIENFEYEKIIVICITKKSIGMIYEYLKT